MCTRQTDWQTCFQGKGYENPGNKPVVKPFWFGCQFAQWSDEIREGWCDGV